MRTAPDPDKDPLVAAAGRVTEGEALDWDAAMAASAERSGALAQLASLDRMARAWREVRGETAPPAAGPAFRWGDLEAREKLGEGSFGEVWSAWDPALQRLVALKVARAGGDPGAARRKLDEARRLARVRHPNVLAIHGVDVRDGRPGLWSELIDGETLEASLGSRGPMGAAEAGSIGLDLCRALAAVHAAGLVHGDVKPANVMREQGGRIVLMDFGSVAESGPGLLEVPTGTPLAMAPEVLAGGDPTPRSDIWSLGATLHRLVTGRWPLTATSVPDLRERHARRERASLRAARPDLPTSFVTVVDRALAHDPPVRYAGAGALEAALAGALALPGPRVPAPRPRWRSPVLFALAAACAVLAVATWWATQGRAPAARPVLPTDRPGIASTLPRANTTPLDKPAASAPRAEAPARQAEAPDPVVHFLRDRDGTEEDVASGALLRVGDRLSLELRSSRAVYVYVLNEDDQGEVYALFPVRGTSLSNPLAAGRAYRLPGEKDGEPFQWQVSSAGGHERFLVIVSATALEPLERQIAAVATEADEQAPLAYSPVPDELVATMRGVGRLVPAEPSPSREGKLGALARSLTGQGHVWVRSFEMLNPGN